MKLVFSFLRLFNKGEPSRAEAAYCLRKYNYQLSQIVKKVAIDYIRGKNIDQIAVDINSTKERVRQIIRKCCRKPISYREWGV